MKYSKIAYPVLLEIFDDVQRCLKDRETNSKRTARVLSGGKKERRPWKVMMALRMYFQSVALNMHA